MSVSQSPIAFALAGFAQGTVQLHTQLSTFKCDTNDLMDSPGLPMTKDDMENVLKAQATVITPPTTQELSVSDDFATEVAQDQALVDFPRAASHTTAPLFESATTTESGITPPTTQEVSLLADFATTAAQDEARITPPTTQKLSLLAYVATAFARDQALTDFPRAVSHTTAPLFESTTTNEKLALPEKFNKTFNFSLFAEFMATVQTCVDSPLRLCEYLHKGIKVTLRERLGETNKATTERITYEELWKRAISFLILDIPGFKHPLGMEHAARNFNIGPTPWFYAGSLAFEGKLYDVPTQTTLEFLEAEWYRVRNLRFRTKAAVHTTAEPKQQRRGRQTLARQNRGAEPAQHQPPEPRKPSNRQRKRSHKAEAELDPGTTDKLSNGQSSDPQTSKSLHVTSYNTPTKSQASNDVGTPEPAASIESTEPAKSRTGVRFKGKKRKRDTDDDASPVSHKSAKRTAFDFNNNNEGSPGRFAQAVKHFLNEKSSDPSDFNAFADGKSLCPSDGPASDKHKEEMALAKELLFTEAQYKTQKYRFFLAAAMLTEQNIRLERYRAAGQKVHMSPLNLNKTQIQLYNNVDVNKSSKLFTKFKDFGWIPDNVDKKKKLNTDYETMFPEEKRKALLDELVVFEATKVTDEKKRVVQRSMD